MARAKGANGWPFPKNYRDAPVVHLSLSLWDMDNNANIRADLVAETVRVDGFGLVFRTWADTRVARVRIAWMSIGEIRSEDDWDLS